MVLGRLFLLFTLVPALELWLLISVGGWLGAAPTIALVLVTGVVGAWLAKREGFRVLRSWQEASAQGQLPKDGIIASVLVLVGGVLLVTPGVITDFVGLALLLPGARRFTARHVRKALEKKFQITPLSPGSLIAGGLAAGMRPDAPPDASPDGDVIDVEAHEAEPSASSAPPA